VATQIISEGVLERKRNVTAVVATWFLAKTYPDPVVLSDKENSMSTLFPRLLVKENILSTKTKKDTIS
jgi:hypothetical protein